MNNERNNNLLNNDRYDKTSNKLAKDTLQDTHISIERILDATSEISSGLETTLSDETKASDEALSESNAQLRANNAQLSKELTLVQLRLEKLRMVSRNPF